MPGARPPKGPDSLVLTYKICKNVTASGVHAPLREILDPPLVHHINKNWTSPKSLSCHSSNSGWFCTRNTLPNQNCYSSRPTDSIFRKKLHYKGHNLCKIRAKHGYNLKISKYHDDQKVEVRGDILRNCVHYYIVSCPICFQI